MKPVLAILAIALGVFVIVFGDSMTRPVPNFWALGGRLAAGVNYRWVGTSSLL